MIYLDNAATTFPKPEAVYVTMDKWNREYAVNAGRGSYKLAREASKMIVDTKKKIRELVNADVSSGVVFSPSVTIAMNQIVNGLPIKDGDVLYVSPYEHNAVARTIYALSKDKRITIKELPIDDKSLEIDLNKTKYEFAKDKPSFVFCTHVSNVTGYILPVEEIFREARNRGAITVLDSAQSLGLIEVDSKLINADIIAFASHKTLYGPFGIGGFVNISSIELNSYITGGTGSDSLNLEMPTGNESRFEASSQNIVAIAGLNAALSVLDQKANLKHEQELTEYLVEGLSRNKKVRIVAPYDKTKYVGIVSFVYDDMNSEDVGQILDEDFDIAVRTGYHCAPFIHKYLKDNQNLGTIRIGISKFTTKDVIEELIDALKEI